MVLQYIMGVFRATNLERHADLASMLLTFMPMTTPILEMVWLLPCRRHVGCSCPAEPELGTHAADFDADARPDLTVVWCLLCRRRGGCSRPC